MQSSVLGKRSQSQSYSDSPSSSQDLITPETTPNPKRLKTSATLSDVHSDSNKENVPPLSPANHLRRASTSVISVHDLRTPRRYSSNSHPVTPATSLSHLSLATPPPTPHSSLTPLHVRVRALLRSTSNGTSALSGRSHERDLIMKFISSFVEGDDADGASSLYISGSPGTGKTALVNAILKELDSSSLNVININCMALNDVDALWDRIIDEISPSKKLKGTKGLAGINKLLQTASKYVLILDELDHITTCSRSLKSLFSLSHTNSSCLRIIGIANTHTLTSSSSQLELDGTSRVSTLHFSPYPPEELLEILRTRLAPVFTDPIVEKASKQFLPTPALTLLTKKIASQTGDVRALFEVLRGAIDIAVASTPTKSNPLDCSIVVSPPHILSALKAYAPTSNSRSAAGTSEVVTKVRNLGLHARLLLLSLSLACRRVEAKLPFTSSTPAKAPSMKRSTSAPLLKTSVESAQLHLYYTNLLTKGSDVFTPVSRSEFVDIINMLETLGLVSSTISAPSTPSKNRNGFGRSGSFAGNSKSAGSKNLSFVEGVRVDEITRGLGLEQQAGNDAKDVADVREEELRAIWDKETREIKRLISINGRSKDAGASGFEDMAED